MEKFFQEVVDNFQSLSLADKAGFTFWSLCVLAFYFSLGMVLFLITKEGIGKLKSLLK